MSKYLISTTEVYRVDREQEAAKIIEEDKKRGFEHNKYNPLNDYYLTTKLTIFNRWGRIVYKSEDYQNDFLNYLLRQEQKGA